MSYAQERKKSQEEADAALLPKLTPEFLATLRECGRVTGWSNDYCEVVAFIKDIHRRADYEPPNQDDLEPYE